MKSQLLSLSLLLVAIYAVITSPESQAIRHQLAAAETDPPKLRETDWSKRIAADFRAQGTPAETEFVCPDGSRVDVLTPEFAAEVEWLHHWKESIGQAVFYGVATNRRPMVILLMSKADDSTNYLRCAVVCAKLNIELRAQKID